MNNHPHPGLILNELYLKPLKMTITDTAKKIGVARNTLSNLIHGKSRLSPSMAIRLAKLFPTISTPEYWLNLQKEEDSWQETLYVASMPGAVKRILEAINEPIEECITHDEAWK